MLQMKVEWRGQSPPRGTTCARYCLSASSIFCLSASSFALPRGRSLSLSILSMSSTLKYLRLFLMMKKLAINPIAKQTIAVITYPMVLSSFLVSVSLPTLREGQTHPRSSCDSEIPQTPYHLTLPHNYQAPVHTVLLL